MTEQEFEEKMDSYSLDDEYWDYVTQHGSGEICLCEDAIFQAIEDGKYYEGFKEYMTNEKPTPNGCADGHDYPACALFRGGKCTCDLASKVETVTYDDGTKATGLPPLPNESPSKSNL